MEGNAVKRLRDDMVAQQLKARGVADPRVLHAMGHVERERFIPESLRHLAYEDRPVPLWAGQTISQPYIVALMAEALRLTGGERVLEIGTGSGYAAAVLACLAGEVHSVERIESLAAAAGKLLAELGYRNVQVHDADGTLGWPDAAPYDAIVVAAGGPSVPAALKEQLAVGGRLVIPVGDETDLQRLVRLTRLTADRIDTEVLLDVRFVPLIGQQGWPE
jgi:protein-L-isoaspartate(D-aspartate) O-methyltransferase